MFRCGKEPLFVDDLRSCQHINERTDVVSSSNAVTADDIEVTMRKAVFFVFLLLGISGGYLHASGEEWSVRIVMMALGAMFGAPIGGALSQIGKRSPRLPLQTQKRVKPIPGELVPSSREVAANYWRDEGHPPFTKLLPPEIGQGVCDAHK